MLNELIEYMQSFHKVTKGILKFMFASAFLLYVLAMYFAMAAGRTMDYYFATNIFFILTENAKGIIAACAFPSLIFEYFAQKYIS